MEKSKAYDEGIQLSAKKVLVKNPKIYGYLAAALFLVGLVFVFLQIFQSRVGEDNIWAYSFTAVEHWFPTFCVILSAVLSVACIGIALLAANKKGKGIGIAAIIGLVNAVLLLFMLLFMNTTTVTYQNDAGAEAKTTIARYYAAKPMLEGTEMNWMFAMNSFSWAG